MRTSMMWTRLTMRKRSGKGVEGSQPVDSCLRGQVRSAILGGVARAVFETLLRWLLSSL